jgi:hypothetical protein
MSMFLHLLPGEFAASKMSKIKYNMISGCSQVIARAERHLLI